MTSEPATDEWAQVEIFGHRRHFGRVAEVERFGAKVMRIEVPTADPHEFEVIYYGGAAIFSVVPCSEDTARKGAENQRPRAYVPQRLGFDFLDDAEEDVADGDGEPDDEPVGVA